MKQKKIVMKLVIREWKKRLNVHDKATVIIKKAST